MVVSAIKNNIEVVLTESLSKGLPSFIDLSVPNALEDSQKTHS